MTTLTIAPRFCGPPGTGNGGYVAGRLAAALEDAAGDAAVEVTLRRPVPLAPRALRVVAGEEPGTARLLDEAATCLAEARLVPGASLAPPPLPRPPPREAAESAARRVVGVPRHGVSGCFVCGPSRAVGDGLRIFAGALDAAAEAAEGRIVAAPWVPDRSIAGAEGAWARPEFVWAALDCPGAFAVMPQGEGAERSAGMLLGRITARRMGAVRIGEPCVVLGWPIAGEAGAGGRRRFAGTAVFGADGGLRALARAVWFLPAPAAA
jgi:hypothetical protein